MTSYESQPRMPLNRISERQNGKILTRPGIEECDQ